MEEHERNYMHWDFLTIVARVMLTSLVAVFVMWSGVSNYVLDYVVTGFMVLGEYL